MNTVFNGNISRCRICNSKFHFVKDCPHKQLDVNLTEHESDESNETLNITLFTSAQEFKPLTVFVAEAYNAAVIDTACSKTVCGSKWLYEFVESLDPDQLLVMKVMSHSTESSEKVRRALSKQILPTGERFKNGDKVFFLRDNQWKGSCLVIGQDNEVVFVGYGEHMCVYMKVELKDTLMLKENKEEPHHNDTDNDESQENGDGYADDSFADSLDRGGIHAGNNFADGSQNGSLNGEDSPDTDDVDGLQAKIWKIRPIMRYMSKI
ncbi:unnamed protein product [Mytilus coruscus]|uniref:CCHC-type domain-containing protein n=1 Tax=Mytilus coruscus TaxID=42192 RepID=A0A6J8B113_MYTCO|nr:unnamed protein product [Mytilus coruscus]